MKLKANPFIFTFIHLFVESAPAHPKPRNVSPFKVITFYLLPILKTYEAATFCLTPMLQPHTFLLLISSTFVSFVAACKCASGSSAFSMGEAAPKK